MELGIGALLARSSALPITPTSSRVKSSRHAQPETLKLLRPLTGFTPGRHPRRPGEIEAYCLSSGSDDAVSERSDSLLFEPHGIWEFREQCGRPQCWSPGESEEPHGIFYRRASRSLRCVYADQDAARGDWDAIKQLAKDDAIKVDGLVLVSRGDRRDRSMSTTTSMRPARAPRGARSEARSSELIFPPACSQARRSERVSARVQAHCVSHAEKKAIKSDVEETLPINSSGIVAVFEEQWADDIDKALSRPATSRRRRSTRTAQTRSRPRRPRTSWAKMIARWSAKKELA